MSKIWDGPEQPEILAYCQHQSIWHDTTLGIYQCGAPHVNIPGCGKQWLDPSLTKEVAASQAPVAAEQLQQPSEPKPEVFCESCGILIEPGFIEQTRSEVRVFVRHTSGDEKLWIRMGERQVKMQVCQHCRTAVEERVKRGGVAYVSITRESSRW